MKWPFVSLRRFNQMVDSYVKQSKVAVTFIRKYQEQCRRAAALEIELNDVKARLIQASKNDKRDPKTGRYTKG